MIIPTPSLTHQPNTSSHSFPNVHKSLANLKQKTKLNNNKKEVKKEEKKYTREYKSGSRKLLGVLCFHRGLLYVWSKKKGLQMKAFELNLPTPITPLERKREKENNNGTCKIGFVQLHAHRHTHIHTHTDTHTNLDFIVVEIKINNKPSMIDNWYLKIGYCIQIKAKFYQTSIIIKVKK